MEARDYGKTLNLPKADFPCEPVCPNGTGTAAE